MKFEIYGESFKKTADRAMSILPKNVPFPALETIKITAEDGLVKISATDVNHFVDVTVDANVVEPGTVYVHKENLKKVYNLSDFVTIESDNKFFNVKNSKKCCETVVADFEEKCYLEFPTIGEDVSCLFEISEKELISSFDKMNCFRGDNFAKREMLKGFNLDGKTERITASDGYRMVTKKLNAKFDDADFNITIHGDSCMNLKQVGNIKSDNKLKVLYGKSPEHNSYFVFFKGADFNYRCKILDGEYFNFESFLNIHKGYSFKILGGELEGIAKEYSKEKNIPMYIVRVKDGIYTNILSTTFQTADKIESAEDFGEIEQGYCFCCDPQYIKDAMTLFRSKDDKIEVYGENKLSSQGTIISAIYFTDGNYTALILPKATDRNTVEDRISFVEKLA